MPDRDKSTLPLDSAVPSDPQETTGFHETLLYLFRPRDAAALRHVGRLLYHLVLEADPYFGQEGESTTRRELEAALGDAVHLRDFLWGVSREVEASELPAGDARLSLFAGEMVSGMDQIISALQEALR